jgi:phosphatidylglycerol:prolipoprotein diacylglycerol transferase
VLPEIHVALAGKHFVLATHALAVLLGVAAGTALVLHRARDLPAMLGVVAVVTVAALAGARGYEVAARGGSGGLASTGGIAAGLLTAWLSARLAGMPVAAVLDAIVPAGLLALAAGRVGCFLAGCCYGRPTDAPLGVVFPDLGLPARHPLQLYSAAGDLIVLLGAGRPSGPPGAVARRICVGFGGLRAGLELLRDPTATLPLGRWLTLPQVAGLGLAAAAIVAGRPCASGGLRLCLARLRTGAPHPTEDSPAWPKRSRSRR